MMEEDYKHRLQKADNFHRITESAASQAAAQQRTGVARQEAASALTRLVAAEREVAVYIESSDKQDRTHTYTLP